MMGKINVNYPKGGDHMDFNKESNNGPQGPQKPGDNKKPNLWLTLVITVLAVILIASIYNILKSKVRC